MPTPKPYKVSAVPGPPNFDSLPVAKITDYPLEERDYMPFAQCILCVGAGRLHLRMWAFEVSPAPTSALACVLYPWPKSPESGLVLRIEHGRGDRVEAVARPEGPAADSAVLAELAAAVETHPHNGEDLQGVYWGMALSLPLALVERVGGETALAPGHALPGNFFKTCEDHRFAHQGSYFRADFRGNPYSRESMGEFRVVAY